MTSSAKRSRTKKAAPSGISSSASSSPLWASMSSSTVGSASASTTPREREAQRQELQAKGLLDFDEPADEADTEPADDDFWTEDSDAEATPTAMRPATKQTHNAAKRSARVMRRQSVRSLCKVLQFSQGLTTLIGLPLQ